MIHIATPHTKDLWLDIQARHLKETTEGEFWTHIRGGTLSHGQNLNRLAQDISKVAASDDLLVFMDGDAFPVQPWDSFVRELLEEYPLVAVRRDETKANQHPHPCFTATTVGFWREIGGDWMPGAVKRGPTGKAKHDVGGRVLNELTSRKVEWKPLTRVNKTLPHPRMFSLYGDGLPLVYHHGAGFRKPTFADRVDILQANLSLSQAWYDKIREGSDFWKELM